MGIFGQALKRYFVEALVGLHQSIRMRTRAREEVWFADDSPLEEGGFEPSVPPLRKALLGVASRDVRT
jgi:hypothetical protein